MSTSSVGFTAGSPETVLEPPSSAVQSALLDAAARPDNEHRDAFAKIAAASPRCLEAWAGLAESASDPIDQYAFARVGYHRGLDALRAAGWRGTGYVRWVHPSNQGFLRCLEALRDAAGRIGEVDEQERCAVFLRQLDPAWSPLDRSG